MATQAFKYGRIAVPLIFLWLNIIFDWIPAISGTDAVKPILIILPFVAFVLFGLFQVYSIVSIIRGVCSLKDRPEEVERLRREIADAKTDLRQKGLKID